MEKIVLSAPIDLVYDRRKDGWKLLSDVPLLGESVLELVEFLHDGENYVNGEVALARATELGQMAGQRHAERMLGMTDQFPKSWRAFVLGFPGTVWQATGGGRHVPFLRWYVGWRLDWSWLVNDWHRHVRLVRVSQT